MEDTIVLYASPEHLDSMLILADFIAKHHPSLSVMILSTASASAAASVEAVPSITYYRLPAAALPPNLPTNLFELFFEIPRLHNPILRETLQGISEKSRIKAFVMDFFCNSAYEVSTSLNIPTYFYVSSCGFHVCVLLYFPTLHETIFPKDIGSLNDFLEIPGCPPIHSLDFPDSVAVRESNSYKHLLNTGINMRKSAGIIANSFDALELKAREALSNDLCTPNGRTPPAFFIGPLVGEEKISSDGIALHECLRWLDLQPHKSVIYLCFGRGGLFSANQLKEMAIGLEKCGHRFLWVVRNPSGNQQPEPDLNALLPDGFLERTKNRGFVLTSWAPQKEILRHDSVGVFVTHCGWSSVLESVSFDVPMICWPLYAEQKMNQVFIVEEIKVGLPLEAENNDGFVTADQLEMRIKEVMNSEKMKVIQGRVTEMKKAGQTAVMSGGSSVVALEKFIELVRQDD